MGTVTGSTAVASTVSVTTTAAAASATTTKPEEALDAGQCDSISDADDMLQEPGGVDTQRRSLAPSSMGAGAAVTLTR